MNNKKTKLKIRSEKKNLKILLVSPAPPPPGGIATVTSIILKEINNHSDITINHIDTAVKWKEVVNKSRIIALIGGSIQALRDILRVWSKILIFRPHALHLNTSAGFSSFKDIIIILVARIYKIPSIIQYHTSRLLIDNKKNRLQWEVAILAARLANSVAVLDQNIYDLLNNTMPKKNIVKLPNMIDLNKIQEIIPKKTSLLSNSVPKNRKNIIFVGHVIPEKGTIEQILACSEFKNVHLHFVGPVTALYKDKLQLIARRNQFSSKLHFYGSVDHNTVYKLITHSDILILPSYSEGFPISLLEGMALCKPIIASQVGAIPEILGYGTSKPCGICVIPGDTESLKIAIQYLITHPEMWIYFGNNARQRSKELFSSEIVTEQLIQQWEHIISY